MEGKKIATFQERFSELIDSSPKSRTEIASEFGVAKQTISAWITGQSSPRLPVVTSLAEYFGVSSQWLLGFDVPKRPFGKIKLDLFGPSDNYPQTSEAQILAKGIDKMPKEQREQALNIIKAVFTQYADYFNKENDDET